jgi:hypothetical protein
MDELKVPVPVPLVVFESFIVGPVLVDQTTPLAVIDAPPSAVIIPPVLAPLFVIEVTAVVVNDDNTAVTVIVPVAFTLPQPPVKGMV